MSMINNAICPNVSLLCTLLLLLMVVWYLSWCRELQVSLVDYLMYAMEVMMNIMANVNKSIRHTDDIKNDCCIAELLS